MGILTKILLRLWFRTFRHPRTGILGHILRVWQRRLRGPKRHRRNKFVLPKLAIRSRRQFAAYSRDQSELRRFYSWLTTSATLLSTLPAWRKASCKSSFELLVTPRSRFFSF